MLSYFLKANKTIVITSLILLIIVPIFGINFFISLLGNVLLLVVLIPLLILLVIFISFNSIKSNFNQCSECGFISMGSSEVCMYCNSELNKQYDLDSELTNKASERIIEVKAEEIK